MFDLCADVIGVVQDMRYCQVHDGTGKKLQVNFTLRDLTDVTLNYTLWESYVGTFIHYNNERKENSPVIVLLKYDKVKEGCFSLFLPNVFKTIDVLLISLYIIIGRFPLSISNTYSFTKLFINNNIAEINQFRERFCLICENSTLVHTVLLSYCSN